MSFEEWFFNYYGRGKMGTVPTGPIPPGYDPNQAIQADLGRLGKRAKDYFERTFGEKSGPKLGEPMPGERPALQMPGLTSKVNALKDWMGRESGNATIPLPGYRNNPNYLPSMPGSGLPAAFNSMMGRSQPAPTQTPYPRPPYQTPYIGPYPGVPMPTTRLGARIEYQGAQPAGEPSPQQNMNEPLPTQDEDEITPPDYMYDTTYPGMREG